MTANSTTRTVLGDIPQDALGFVLPHEHLYCSQLAVFPQPSTDAGRRLAHEKVTVNNAPHIRQEPLQNLDNILLPGGSLVEEELIYYVQSGGRTLVELTSIGACRNITEIVRLSMVTGLNIVAGTGYYTQRSHPPEVAVNDAEWLAKEMIMEIEEGIDGTSARAGVIGEVGTSLPILDQERKVLAASVLASKATGRPIIVHVQPPAHLAHEVLDILFQYGADPNRIALAHMDSTLRPGLTYHREVLSRGVSIIYDGFGMEWDFPSLGLKTPSDKERVLAVAELVASGFTNQLLLSQDVCTKIHLATYGGPGYSHLLKNILPMLLNMGLSDDEVTTIVRTNPANLITVTNGRN